ncbi:hypothetical protein BIW11_11982 [Tropilaelaps mercedesae]|uniref:Uncharacterized protein n=1 Tax=Tropilaelaps mercedesae TaxID=418985 RepID=A0A1V9X954_9ACAR|nr:hypothetical protein BIW11_11982 [Tropilaelaps mercedesae]
MLKNCRRNSGTKRQWATAVDGGHVQEESHQDQVGRLAQGCPVGLLVRMPQLDEHVTGPAVVRRTRCEVQRIVSVCLRVTAPAMIGCWRGPDIIVQHVVTSLDGVIVQFSQFKELNSTAVPYEELTSEPHVSWPATSSRYRDRFTVCVIVPNTKLLALVIPARLVKRRLPSSSAIRVFDLTEQRRTSVSVNSPIDMMRSAAMSLPASSSPATTRAASSGGREVYRNGWLRCIPYLQTSEQLPKSHLENLFVSFCVHDNDGPWLEFYDNRHCSADHKPVARRVSAGCGGTHNAAICGRLFVGGYL